MNLLIDGVVSTVLDDDTFKKVLTIYPEEELEKRLVFATALDRGEISYSDLRKESERCKIPWQLFLLNKPNMTRELAAIEKRRHKLSRRLLAKRPGLGQITSKRILDRLLRCQTYLTQEGHGTVPNTFCGSLKGRGIASAAAHITKHFKIDAGTLRRKNKVAALEYLIERFEDGGINVCQGVLTNGMLPHLPGSRSVYKNTSGFVIKDDHFPFLFIPSEINPDEKDGRQILTLIFLIALIGLEAYDYVIEKDFKVSMLGASGRKRVAYNITSEFLLPFAETERLRGTSITASVRDDLAKRHKITPSAVMVILRKRDLITVTQYTNLMPGPIAAGAKRVARTPKIEASVRKFNGRYAMDFINKDFAARKLTSVQVQYLLFGLPNRKAFRQYRRNLSL